MEKTSFVSFKSKQFEIDKLRALTRYGETAFELEPDSHLCMIQFKKEYNQTPRVRYWLMMNEGDDFTVVSNLSSIEKDHFVIAMCNECDKVVKGVIFWEALIID